ncbi:ABC transporter substrate-binding protein [Chromohalobacter sp. TMW 2.2308]|uniref:ABC transporter substrate-binding protein n=1 Tax=Chromohalobacter TaxID=42054 RepID=UPI001FFD72A7|nr:MULTISPECIES: ABC transporter substrate-binding protein [Chromohalobacter]MCK2042743.1 ABC transporter substrate-binding protein [Chromohalobacter moromii]MCT8514737.1 ABC transporter substrate-binding protein [Chromohalobacter sp. TMW 2.2271]
MTFSRGLLLAALSLLPTMGQAYELSDWDSVTEAARGQTVYWNAWGGDPRTNTYIDWVADQVDERYGIDLEHVKVGDTGEAVTRVVAEKAAGNDDQGAVDLIWLNGENFAAMKDNDLLYGPWAEQLPHFPLTAPEQNPEVREDFTLPVEGYEAPWGRAQITFYYDSARVDEPPRSISALLDWARAHPGRFTYPQPPAFLGTTFLKQALLALTEHREALYAPVNEADFESVTAPLWDYLDRLHPSLWREGERFPAGGPQMRQLMGDGALSLAFTFTPSAPAAAVLDYQLPPTTRSYILDDGTLGNVHFVAIPFNAQHKAGALTVANFLLSPEAQARKQDLSLWGDATVLDMSRLNPEQREAFARDGRAAESLPPPSLGETLREPHPSWIEPLEKAWRQRYGAQ